MSTSKQSGSSTPPKAHQMRPDWSWRSTGDPGLFELRIDGETVGIITLLPGHVQHRAVLLDLIVDHLNQPPD